MVDRARLDRQGLPVALPQLLEPLIEAAVDQHAPPGHLEEELRACDGSSGAEKLQGDGHAGS